MSSSIPGTAEGTDRDRDHGLREAIMTSTKQIVESQQASMDLMVGKLVEMLTSMTEVLNHQNVLLGNISIPKAGDNATTSIILSDLLSHISDPNAGSTLRDHKVEKAKEEIDEEVENEITGNNSVHANASILLSDRREEEEFGNHISGEIQQVNDDQVTQNTNEETAEREVGINFDGLHPIARAVAEEDWKTAIRYVKNNKAEIEETLRSRDFTKAIGIVLNLASIKSQWKFVEAFAKLAPPKSLELVHSNGFTILHMAASFGNIKVVKALVNINRNLTLLIGSHEKGAALVPLAFAAMSSTDDQMEILEYLYPITRHCSMSHDVTRDVGPSPFKGDPGCRLVEELIGADAYGIALSICQENLDLVPQLTSEYNLLRRMVERPSAFLSGSNLTWWERSIYSLIEANIEGEKNDLSGVSSKSTKKDEENPPETSQESAIRKGFPTGYKGHIIPYVSIFLRRCLTLVPHIKQLYKRKLMHKQAAELVKLGLTLIHIVLDEEQQKTYFNNSGIIAIAIKYGTTEFVLKCLKKFPFLCLPDGIGWKIYKMIIQERNVEMFNYICKSNENKNLHRIFFSDEDKNTILHYAAGLATTRQLNTISGATFQLQREMQWFKETENIVQPKDRFVNNRDGHTAQYLFTENHKVLMEKAEEWMKKTSGSCMLVSALIATVAFAAALNVPGGIVTDNSSSNYGLPVFLGKKSFRVFATADALALFSSITSILMFLVVCTSRYTEEDFLKSLPQKMIIGLGTLFVSMAALLVSFGAAFTILLGKQISWAPFAVGSVGSVPVLLFGFLQFPLFVGMIHSTYWPIVFRKRKLRNSKRDIWNKKEN